METDERPGTVLSEADSWKVLERNPTWSIGSQRPGRA